MLISPTIINGRYEKRPIVSDRIRVDHTNPLSRGLVRVFLCNDGAGNIIREYVRGDHAIQDDGGNAWVSDIHGPTFAFRTSDAGAQDSFQFSDIIFTDSQPWSVAMGCDRFDDGSTQRGAIVGDGVDADSDYILLGIDSASDRVVIRSTDGQFTNFTDTGILPEGYHDWLITSNGGGTGSGTAKIHFDGQEFLSASTRNLGMIFANIGSARSTTGGAYSGRLFYVYIYDHELSNAEAISMRNNPYQILKSLNFLLPAHLSSTPHDLSILRRTWPS